MNSNEIKFYDLYKPLQPIWYKSPYSIMILVGATAFIILFLIFLLPLFFRKKKLPSAWEQALSEFHHLKISQEIELRDRYYRMIIALKYHFSACYNESVYAMTDDEFVAFLKKVNFPSDLLQRVERICTHAGDVRFIGQPPSEELFFSDIDRAIEVVRNSIPKVTT